LQRDDGGEPQAAAGGEELLADIRAEEAEARPALASAAPRAATPSERRACRPCGSGSATVRTARPPSTRRASPARAPPLRVPPPPPPPWHPRSWHAPQPVVFRAREVCDAGRGGQEAELDLAKTELARLQFLEQQQYGDEQVIMSEHHHTTFIRSAKVCAKVRS
jgi:hypothetical protein